jgi:hypothetical protein
MVILMVFLATSAGPIGMGLIVNSFPGLVSYATAEEGVSWVKVRAIVPETGQDLDVIDALVDFMAPTVRPFVTIS